MDNKKLAEKDERLHRIMNIHFSSFFDDMPLTYSQAKAIKFIMDRSQEGDVFPRDIEDYLTVRGSSVASLINHLDQKGYLIREPVAFDGRFKRLVPTEKAYAIKDKIEERINQYVTSLYIGLSEDELAVYEKVMDRLEENITVKE